MQRACAWCARRRAPATTGASFRLSPSGLARLGEKAPAHRSRYPRGAPAETPSRPYTRLQKRIRNFAPGLSRQQVLDAVKALLRDLDAFRRDAGARLRGRPDDEMQTSCGLHGPQADERKLDFLDLLLLVRNLVRGDRRGPQLPAGSLRPYLRRRVSGYRSAASRNPDPAFRRRPGRKRLARGHARPRQALRRRRSQAVHLQFRRADVVLYENVCAGARSARRGAHRLIAKAIAPCRPSSIWSMPLSRRR